MERGLFIELSPNEETALHRVAQGLMLTEDMQQRHLTRLKQLALIEETGTDFTLTVLGLQRLALRGRAPPDGRGLEGHGKQDRVPGRSVGACALQRDRGPAPSMAYHPTPGSRR